MKKTKIYSKCKRKMTEEDRKIFDKMQEKEHKKFNRDSKCGGIDEKGNYTALHYRKF